jgi:cobyrinic acid a,c-diamide synthase
MNGSLRIPRLVVAGTASGVGKTTVMVGLCRALRLQGLKVAVFKSGPDYLDPTYHSQAAGVPSHTLDGWMMGKEAVLNTFASVGGNADIALIEGVMGLFDGASAKSEEGSTAQIAKWLQAPVLLVVDASGMARSIAAMAQGFSRFDLELRLAGVLCNNVGSRGHLDLLRSALDNPPVLGGLPKQPALHFPERHLGLHTAKDSPVSEAVLNRWGELIAEWFDLDTILTIARSAADLDVSSATQLGQRVASSARGKGNVCRIGYAYDAAFHFYYEDNLRRLRDLGAELVPFSPIADTGLPAVEGLYLGGGYPELHAAALSANHSLRNEITAFAAKGKPIYAECGGLMYLSSAIKTFDGTAYPMVGLIPGEAVMHDRLQALGYVEVETTEPSVLGAAGLHFRGHQFRYSELQQPSAAADCVYQLHRRRTGAVEREGYCRGHVLASYVHAHWASNPLVAAGFVNSCAAYAP